MRGSRALGRVGLQHTVDQLAQPAVGDERRRHHGDGARAIGIAAHDEAPHDDAQRVHVGLVGYLAGCKLGKVQGLAVCAPLLAQHLGRLEQRRASRHPRQYAARRREARHAEVADLGDAAAQDEDVLELDVVVHDAVLFKLIQRAQKLAA